MVAVGIGVVDLMRGQHFLHVFLRPLPFELAIGIIGGTRDISVQVHGVANRVVAIAGVFRHRLGTLAREELVALAIQVVFLDLHALVGAHLFDQFPHFGSEDHSALVVGNLFFLVGGGCAVDEVHDHGSEFGFEGFR